MIRTAAKQAVLTFAVLALCAGSAWAAPNTTTLAGHRMRVQHNDHALGLTVGYGGTNGFAYRKYFGNTFVQANILPLVADRGDYLALMFGATVGRYLIVWNRPRTRSLMPSTTALRAVGTVATYFTRDALGVNDLQAPCSGVNCSSAGGSGTSDAKIENLTTAAAGIGIEFGAILRNGFSMSVDVMLTSAWDEDGFLQILPLPYAAVMYSW